MVFACGVQFFAHRKKKAMVEALEKVKTGEQEEDHRWLTNGCRCMN
jgi:hypothetical protein